MFSVICDKTSFYLKKMKERRVCILISLKKIFYDKKCLVLPSTFYGKMNIIFNILIAFSQIKF